MNTIQPEKNTCRIPKSASYLLVKAVVAPGDEMKVRQAAGPTLGPNRFLLINIEFGML